MKVIKRNQDIEMFQINKIKQAIQKVFYSFQSCISEEDLQRLIDEVCGKLHGDVVHVETIQDLVEEALMHQGHLQEAKAYILYRENHRQKRVSMDAFVDLLGDEGIRQVLVNISQSFDQKVYDLQLLLQKFRSFYKPGMARDEAYRMVCKACVELISKDEPKWEFIAARFLAYQIHQKVNHEGSFYEKLVDLTQAGLYGDYILTHYTKEEVDVLEVAIDDSRDDLFTYSGLELLSKRYLMQDHHHQLLETPQQCFMGISMHLAMKEKDKVYWAKQFYDLLSSLKVTMATPTISNARKPLPQMSSCFIDTVDDSLNGIFKSIDSFAKVSKHGGGMGMYFGKVRANGSSIRGYKDAAGGVIRWIKLVNDTAIAVDQLGVRQGACAVYLDAWHKDLPEFLQLKTNNGDDRMKAHDIFPAICYPDLFYKLARQDLDAPWHMMCPHEIHQVKGYYLEDFYGEQWEQKYYECVQDDRIEKRTMRVKEVVRLIIKSLVETGTPFAFNRDHVNQMNPNHHQGMIYCSNLCTEIAQNMQAVELMESEVLEVNGETIVVEKSKPGNFVVCNLASLSLGRIDVTCDEELRHVVQTAVRALDNVIDLNYYPLPYARLSNQRYRPIGLGTSGYHHMLAKLHLPFESEEHLAFVDQLYEKINYYAIEASMHLAREKGAYALCSGSDWETGDYFTKRQYTSSLWQDLQTKVHRYGMRNGYLMAIAPTSSTSILAGTTASIDPVMNKYFMEEKKGSMITRVAPDLSPETFWYYKNAHHIDQTWVVRAAGVRQRHIDQSQSLNVYITNEYTFSKVLALYIKAWEEGVKTVYYVRSRSLEVEECESCSA